ncbi:MAG: hypothetical protein MK082_06565 [Phycisphaerales bacterium]|nr:hypothetical protein [Phycisphaerales bacterium]
MSDSEPIGYCFSCRHPLVATELDSCPECGSWYDPEDPRTSYRRKPGRLALMMMQPSRLPSWLFGFALGALCIVATSVPGGYSGLVIIMLMALTVSVVAFVLDCLVSMTTSSWVGRSWFFEIRPDPVRRVFRWGQLRWFVAPTLVFLALCVSVSGLSARLSFWYSRAALHELIQDESGSVTGTRTMQVSGFRGLYPVRSVTIHNPTGRNVEWATIWIRDAGFINMVGFAFVPDSNDDWCELGSARSGGTGWRYSGDWFLVESDF